MSESIGQQGGFSGNVIPFDGECSRPDLLTVRPTFFDAEPFEATPEDLIGIVAGLYARGRSARSAGDGTTWAACFQEGRLIVDAHRSALNDDQIDALRRQLDEAGYYQEKEMGDPYGLGVVGRQEA